MQVDAQPDYSPISILLPEVLRHVFTIGCNEGYAPRFAYRVSQVCWMWRVEALDHKALWSRVSSRDRRADLESSLSRSGSHLLFVKIRVAEKDNDNNILLSEHIARWRAATVELRGENAFLSHTWNNVPSEALDPEDIAPNLRHLKLTHGVRNYRPPYVNSIRRFVKRLVSLSLDCAMFAASSCSAILQSSFHLEYLDVYSTEILQQPGTTVAPITLPHLTQLRIWDVQYDTWVFFLNHLSAPNLVSLKVGFYGLSFQPGDYPSFETKLDIFIRMCSKLERLSVIADIEGWLWTQWLLRRISDPNFPPRESDHLMPRVTDLVLCAPHLDMENGLMPCLQAFILAYQVLWKGSEGYFPGGKVLRSLTLANCEAEMQEWLEQRVKHLTIDPYVFDNEIVDVFSSLGIY